jgi:hypothetical protein
MKRVMILTMFVFCTMQAVEYSHRISALGTDLAHLVPDYETDLYRNPQFLDKALAGISYAPGKALMLRYSYPYPPATVYQTPISLKFMTRTLGMMGSYWFYYQHDLEPDSYGWLTSTYATYRLQDLWMARMKNTVVNIYNDLDYSRIEYLTSTNSPTIERRLEYLIRTQAAFKIRKTLSLDIKIGFGFFESKTEISDYEVYNQRVNLALARAGLYCRKVTATNDFASWYFDIGSPLSNAEIDSLPYPVYSSVQSDERVFMLSAKTLLARFAFAKAIPITPGGMLIVGLKNVFTLQSTGDATNDTGLRGIINTISLPVGMEHSISTVTLRFGTRFFYDFETLREANEDVAITQDITHTLDYEYTFGLGWKPHKKITVDLYTDGGFWYLKDWAVYLKYAF